MNTVKDYSQNFCRWGRALLVSAVVLGTAAGGLSVSAQDEDFLPEDAMLEPDEPGEINKAPKPDARRIYLLDSRAFEVFTQNMVVDGNTGEYLGTIDSGLTPQPAVAPDGSEFYLADTRYTHFSGGERDDFVRVFDPRTLEQIDEIDIPEGRMLVFPKKPLTDVSPDGRYLIFYQFAPSNALGIVDLENREYLNTIKTPNCFYAFPATDRRVVMHCRDASLLQVTFDEDGNKVSESRTEPFHEPMEEATFDNPAFDSESGKIFFVSASGKVFPVDISGSKPKAGKSFDLLTAEERENNWGPGGWQVADYHRDSKRLFVLMDVRADWKDDHWPNTPSGEVWVYDTTSGERVDKIHLAHEAISIQVDQTSHPHLYGVNEHHGTLDIYDVETGAKHASLDDLVTPHLMALSD